MDTKTNERIAPTPPAEPRAGKLPGPDHPISVEPAGVKVIVRIGETIVACSAKALVLREADLPPVFYIPREDIAMDALSESRTITFCPYKGHASYFDAGSGATRDIAWSYEAPFDHMLAIRGRLAFYPNRVTSIETAALA